MNANGASPGAIDGYFVNAATQRHTHKPTRPFTVLYDYIGDPIRPFPWLTWNNRPFANPMELLLVPASSPERFGWEFSYKTHYTDSVASRLLGQTYPQYRLFDNHYAPMRNPPWDYFSATQICGTNPDATVVGHALVAATRSRRCRTGPLRRRPRHRHRANVASSQTMFPPVQFDPTIDYANNLPYQNLPPVPRP